MPFPSCSAFAAPPPPSPVTLEALKICGVTSAADASLITHLSSLYLPAHTRLYLGMIVWPGSRRSVSPSTAREIARVASDAGATAVGVFVDEQHEAILAQCSEASISTAQLHGPASRLAWPAKAPGIDWIDVRDVHSDSSVSPATSGLPQWTIFDAKGGGTGRPFDWASFDPPQHSQEAGVPRRWMLAGGLDPINVKEAIQMLKPRALDVASGVAGPDKCSKDEDRLKSFLLNTLEAYQEL